MCCGGAGWVAVRTHRCCWSGERERKVEDMTMERVVACPEAEVVPRRRGWLKHWQRTRGHCCECARGARFEERGGTCTVQRREELSRAEEQDPEQSLSCPSNARNALTHNEVNAVASSLADPFSRLQSPCTASTHCPSPSLSLSPTAHGPRGRVHTRPHPLFAASHHHGTPTIMAA